MLNLRQYIWEHISFTRGSSRLSRVDGESDFFARPNEEFDLFFTVCKVFYGDVEFLGKPVKIFGLGLWIEAKLAPIFLFGSQKILQQKIIFPMLTSCSKRTLISEASILKPCKICNAKGRWNTIGASLEDHIRLISGFLSRAIWSGGMLKQRFVVSFFSKSYVVNIYARPPWEDGHR
jgi:hypothetical protein